MSLHLRVGHRKTTIMGKRGPRSTTGLNVDRKSLSVPRERRDAIARAAVRELARTPGQQPRDWRHRSEAGLVTSRALIPATPVGFRMSHAIELPLSRQVESVRLVVTPP